MIQPGDDSFHPRSNSPYWNESAWFGFNIPERKVNGWVYMWHRPNMGLSAGGAALWDPTSEDTYSCLFYHLDPNCSLPDGADMFNFTLDNGLSVECLEPLMSYRLRFQSDGCDLDLHWEGIHPVHELNYSGTPGIDEWGQGHYEQSGRVRGTIEVDGERFKVDCLANRDRSWGPRLSGGNWRRGAYEWANASETDSFGATWLSDLPSDDDPIVGTTERLVHGWYVRDGVAGDLVSGERRVLERGDDGRPLGVVVDARDNLGRDLHAEGRPESLLKWNGPCFVFWNLSRWRFDGLEGWGETQDFMRPQQIRHLQHSRRRLGAGRG